MTNTIKAIENKGYIVKAEENMWLGKLNEECPVVYNIMAPNYTTVYGASGVAPESLAMWADSLPELNAPSSKATTHNAGNEAERASKEREWDNLYNEGGEGYNPYRG